MTVAQVSSRKMQCPLDSSSSSSSAVSTAGTALPSLSRSHSVREQQAQLKHKLRELPSLLRSGLTLRRRSSVYGPSPSLSEAEDTAAATATTVPSAPERISTLYGDNPPPKLCGESVACAGRALRNALRSQAPDLIRDRMYLTCICRKCCVGSELVDWLLQHCPFVQCRYTAAGIWQTLMKLGILISVDKQLSFQDAYVFYQFSSSECTETACEFGRDKAWLMGVHLLKQLAPLAPLTSNICDMSGEKLESTADANSKILQIQALARLTSAVQRELAAVIALKARKSVSDEEDFNCPQQSIPVNAEHSPVETEAGVMCKLHGREELRRIDFVQKLARDNNFLPSATKQLDKKQPDEEDTTVQVKEQDQDVLVLKKVSSSESPAPAAGSGESDWRYMVVSGTPEKILEHLLNDLHLDEEQDKDTDTLLDDFLLTYTVFMTTDDFCQALLRHYCAKKYDGKVESPEALCTKRKVLHLASQWTALYKDWLHNDEHSKLFLKTLYRYVLDDVYEYPTLEKELKEFQRVLRIHRRHTVDEYSPHRKNKALFHQFSLKENWLQHRGNINEIEEIFCRVYITDHSYVSIRAKVSSSVQDILKIVCERIQQPEEDLALVTVTFSGEKHELLPTEMALVKSLESTSRIYTYRKAATLNPFAENEETQHRSVRILGMNTWDIALELTSFDWSLFNSIHEQELIYFTFSRQGKSENTLNLNLLLQRCNEVQLWVATEILLCNQLVKRVQLVKKFIKIAAHCKAQRNLNSFFAIIMGLNTASVSRLSQTWEKIPGKLKKLFSELESLTDPSLNHKAYRDTFKKMKPPKIPFMPLLLKDVTFIHEGNKTFLDNLVNFEKLHMIADTVRSLRYCRNNQFGNDIPQKERLEAKFYTHHLHVIDNQQTLFELSHRIEPRA
ncbi:rap guanine nucleotide exchange factor 5 [Spea bombifrons]|uniref:rap guanine nucleotide exchange factor 5 n=1 Tax=Spea bombifrons TaxID=233779 RepID=UPI00234BD6B1|nr:rap guanine nucleotide exchange factor 5 [Spea bombifrons]